MKPNKQPHIIYILSDEHFGGAMSHMGDPNVRTPHMDQLAANGVSFSRARCNSPICTPSRGTIFSGRQAHAGPVQFFFDVYKPGSPSTATILREAGYHTAYMGKWHCGLVWDQKPPAVRQNPKAFNTMYPTRTPEYHRGGFQDWFGFEVNNQPFQTYYWHQDEIDPRQPAGYQTDILTDLAINYLNTYDRDEPLFLVLSVEPPHFPLEAPDAFERFDPSALAVKSNFHEDPVMRRKLATYYAMVENLDANIGRLNAAVRAKETFGDDTLTVYFSDHGDYMGSHQRIERKELPHEESVRIPTIFHWPAGIPAQPSCDDLFSLVDLLSTTLGLVGIDPPSHSQGVDFSPRLRGEPFNGPDDVLMEMCGNPRWNLDMPDWRAVVNTRWKYAHFETGHEWLFDLENDPGEMTNVADANPAMRDQLRARLLQLLAETREPYYDVIMNDGVKPEGPVLDVSGRSETRISPAWEDLIRYAR
ncbi:MAG: sulfatase-like hydrolase/transferase [Verrucomicrobia bacterium]|nr:sulfatase-like hydrolase/transferase [Verrucomicrobiota bacterium]